MPDLTLLTEQCLARVPGGTGRYTREVARALATSAPPDWQLTGVTAWHRDISAARISGVVGPRRLPLPRRALTAAWERGVGPRVPGDVIHAMTPWAPVSPRLRSGRLVVTVHDAVPYTHPELLTPRGATWHRTMIEAASRDADAIVVPTRTVREELLAHVTSTAPVHVIGEGIPESFAQPAPPRVVAAARERHGLPPVYLIAVGTLEPRKGLPTAIRALERLPQEVHLAIVGPAGWGEQELSTSDRVHLLGRVSDEDLHALVTGAAVSVHASRSEGFGLPLLEAMSVGTPVVHTDIPVFSEVADGAGSPFAVDDDAHLASVVTDLLAEENRRERARAAGRRRALDFSWEAAADALWALYRDLAAAR